MIIGVVLITSCASNTGILPIGEGRYFIAKQAATGFLGTGGIKTDSLMEAASYCTSQKKELNILNLHENDGPFILGRYPRVELTFVCD